MQYKLMACNREPFHWHEVSDVKAVILSKVEPCWQLSGTDPPVAWGGVGTAEGGRGATA